MSQTYWQSAAGDEAMQEDHGLIWEAMLETIDVNLAGKRVLDAGCNRGGFLRYDLAAHARAMFRALVPGGVYYAVIGVHAGSPLMVQWHRANDGEIDLPELYDIDDVVAIFDAAGFKAAAARLQMRFVPATGHGHDNPRRLRDWLDYYYDHKLLLRFGRPAS